MKQKKSNYIFKKLSLSFNEAITIFSEEYGYFFSQDTIYLRERWTNGQKDIKTFIHLSWCYQLRYWGTIRAVNFMIHLLYVVKTTFIDPPF